MYRKAELNDCDRNSMSCQVWNIWSQCEAQGSLATLLSQQAQQKLAKK